MQYCWAATYKDKIFCIFSGGVRHLAAGILVFTPSLAHAFHNLSMELELPVKSWFEQSCVWRRSLCIAICSRPWRLFFYVGFVMLALAIVSQILINLKSIQMNLFLKSFVHVIQFRQACWISLFFLSSQSSLGRHLNPSRCLFSWALSWKAARNSSVDEVHLVALSTMSTSSCRRLFLRENFPTFQPMVVETLYMWTQSVVLVQLSWVPKWKKKKISTSTAFILPRMDCMASQQGLLCKWPCQRFSLGSLFSDTTIILQCSMGSGTGVYRLPDML